MNFLYLILISGGICFGIYGISVLLNKQAEKEEDKKIADDAVEWTKNFLQETRPFENL